MKKLKLTQKITLIITLAYSAWVRLQDLGYAEYQGDEILTLDFRYFQGSFIQYLLSRDKGPLQFVINWLTYNLTGTWEEWIIRLPYALAGIAFVYVLFEVTRKLTKNNWAGILSAALAGTNGLFIAFSRITQYQAFVQLLLGLIILFLLAVENKKAGQGKEPGSKTGPRTWFWGIGQLPLAGSLFGIANIKSKPGDSPAAAGEAPGASLTAAPGAGECGYFCLAGLLFGIAVLAHYDALTFLAFICFYFGKDLISRVILRSESPNDEESPATKDHLQQSTQHTAEDSSASQQPGRPQNDCNSIKLGFWKKKALAFFTPFLILTASFYVPFFLNSTAGETSNYLQRRVLGSGFMPRTLYSKILMKFYMPKEMIFALVILSCLSLYFIIRNSQFPLLKNTSAFRTPLSAFRKLIPITYYLLPVTLIFTFWFSTQWIKPRGSTLMFYTLTLITLGVLFFTPKIDKIKASLFAWFLASSCFYLFFNKTPRTHVYIIFIPLFILSGYTIAKTFSLLNAKSRAGQGKESGSKTGPRTWFWGIGRAVQLITVLVGIYITTTTLTYNHKIFVEKRPEYMWGSKKVFGREMISIDKNLANKVQGIFGFPHRRGWEKIAKLYKNGCLTGSYSTNEKARIPAFYLGKEPIADQENVFEKDADNIIIVEAPISWYYESLDKTLDSYIELKTYFIANHPITKIYGKESTYPNGKTLCE
ncbi:MAG: glycosyltransferase family 39 protein [Patescibacteria group bacterium]|nr:glycosyltransferase family 39 protein [Patescibacteria group bacterium]